MKKHVLIVLSFCALIPGCGVRMQPLQPNEPAVVAVSAPAKSPVCLPSYVWTKAEEQFLDDLERRIFDFFWIEVYPETGIAIDHTENRIGKVAATGFELAAVVIGVQRGWITRDEGYERCWKILNAFYDDPDDPNDAYVDGHFGLFWHFVDGKTGRMRPVDCVAPCDSADFIGGVLLVGEYFAGTPVAELAQKICDRVEWDKFVAYKKDGAPDLMSFGWVPLHVSESYFETDGLLNFNMSGFTDNSLLIYVLALGSDTHPIPQEVWEHYVDSYTLGEYGGYECVMTCQLFCRQVPHAYVPFSRMRDRKIEYFLDTVNAVLADRVYNMRENGYPPQLWGLTDCFGKDSYTHGAPPGAAVNDGTVGTTAFAGALPHVPNLSMEAMQYAKREFGDRLYGKYGFTSSVNLKNNFISPLYVGIELGPMIMLLENARSGLIWDLFARTRVMKNFVQRAGMSGVIDDFELPPEAPAYAQWSILDGQVRVSGDRPQNGFKCMEILAPSGSVTLQAKLSQNELLSYYFNKTLSFWARDLQPETCQAVIDGQAVTLSEIGRINGQGWTHYCYALPTGSETSMLCGLLLKCTVGNVEPALDNITLEAQADLGAPAVIKDFTAITGQSGGALDLSWTVPEDAGGGRIVRYVLSASVSTGSVERVELPAIQPSGAKEIRTILLRSGVRYEVALQALDSSGHSSAPSMPVDVTSQTGDLNVVACDFESGELSSWTSSHTNQLISLVSSGTGHCLRVEYINKDGWTYLMVPVDPSKIALHRYVTVKAKGRLDLLGKLWSRDDLQQDMEVKTSLDENSWTTLKFDTHRAAIINPAKDLVTQILFFPLPGKWGASGVFYLDDLSYSNE